MLSFILFGKAYCKSLLLEFMGGSMNIAILVVTYNRKKLLEENISALLGQTFYNFDLYICDNASTDGTSELVNSFKKKDKRVRYYNTGANLGGAGGFAYGLKIILSKKYDYCWIMDDDSVPDKDALLELIRSADKLKNNFSFLASNVLWIDGNPCKMNQCVFLEKNCINNGFRPIDRCSFVGCFINVAYAKAIGLPIKEFFIYGDDTEYTLRLSERNDAYFCEDSIIVHKMASNVRIGIAESSVERLNRYQYEYRNRIYIYRNRLHYSWLKIVIKYIKECGKVIIRSDNNKIKRLWIIIHGFIEGINFNPQIEEV